MLMIGKIDLKEDKNMELAKRISTRLLGQGEGEIIHVLKKLFPNSKTMRVRSTAVDFSNKHQSSEGEFLGLFETDEVDMDIFNTLSGSEKHPGLMKGRGQFDPTKFELTLTCVRTPFKEFFDECADITCEKCIEGRIQNFITGNEFSKTPFSLNVERVESRRLDICKNCGNMLGKKDDMNFQNERLLYKCSYCGHKGWVKAK